MVGGDCVPSSQLIAREVEINPDRSASPKVANTRMLRRTPGVTARIIRRVLSARATGSAGPGVHASIPLALALFALPSLLSQDLCARRQESRMLNGQSDH